MKKDLKSILSRLESLEENQLGQLQGGFASVGTPGGASASLDGTVVNNCHGGNCVVGCGSKEKAI